jgi:UDP-N-acetylglucosamine--dolichyl-phosphate N-acetylglucosaminephosphotransferase
MALNINFLNSGLLPLLTILLSFFCCLIVLPLWIRKCKQLGLLWEDMNKYKGPKNVGASGGLVVLFSFLLGAFAYIAFRTLYRSLDNITISILAIVLVVLIAGFIGFVDDMLGWKTRGLSMRMRIFLAIMASIPLVVINAGHKTMNLPFFGQVYFGLFYPLLLIPLGVVAVTTVYNFLAGFNGLEAGQGILILGFLSYIAYILDKSWLGIVGLCMVGTLIAFLLFNWNPAKIFGGDVLTYAIGALIVAIAIVGNFEKIAFIVFIPYILEMILKIRGRLNLKNGHWPHAFGIPNKDNSLEPRYNKIYGLTHFSIWFLKKFKKKVYEQDVVLLIFGIQVIFIVLAWMMI